MNYNINFITNAQKRLFTKEFARAEFLSDTKSGYAILELNIETSGADEYLLLPSCAYNGNRFKSVERRYSPKLMGGEASPDMETTISNVPRLNKDGSGKIEVTVSDMATPCIGVYFKEHKKGFLLFTTQGERYGNFGVTCQRKGDVFSVQVIAPKNREKAYRFPELELLSVNDRQMDFSKGESIEIPYKLIEVEAESICEFFEFYFDNRKCMDVDREVPAELPKLAAFELQMEKYNRLNWREQLGVYGIGIEDNKATQVWAAGWCGGAINTYPIMVLGDELSYKRSLESLRFLIKHQEPSGFFHSIVSIDGKILSDNEVTVTDNTWHLIRKSADVLYYVMKQLNFLQNEPALKSELESCIKKTADAFVTLWRRYGQLGQFVDLYTGELIAGGTVSGGAVPAGLVYAYRYFGDEKYLEAANEIGEYYYQNFVCNGFTNGGPGDMLQNPDSESAFALLESFVELYEETREEKWLTYANHQVAQASSWVVTYNFVFPKESEFGRHSIKSLGSVFANVQNKHSAPGLCTLSGCALLKLYKFTGDARYAELLSDISTYLTQSLPREDKVFYSWDKAPRPLEKYCMCERVNMSDWEGENKVGGVFYGSCWCEISLMLTSCELPSVYIDEKNGRIFTFDQVKAYRKDGNIIIENLTDFDSEFTVYVDNGESSTVPCRADSFGKVYISAKRQNIL